MTTVLVAPDKFKGSLTANETCEAIKKGILTFDPEIQCILHPLADGGEGTLEALSGSLSLETVLVEVNDPLFRPIQAEYKLNDCAAYIEMSKASGLELLTQQEKNCMNTTSYGTGELILNAIDKGIKKIYLFIGGSATNDAGIGLASALGYKLFDQEGKLVSPIGGALKDIKIIEDSELKFDKEQLEIKVVCDVKNLLFGPFGAAHVYGPQKGASVDEVEILDQGLINFNNVVKLKYDIDLSTLEGGGAAGGIGAGAVGLLGAQLQSGIRSVMEITDFSRNLVGVDLIITGEGKLDNQTVQGKVVDGVHQLSKDNGIPVSIICGIAEDLDIIEDKINSPIYQLKSDNMSIAYAMDHAKELAEQTSFRIMKDFTLGKFV